MAQSERFYDYVKEELECPVCQEVFTKNNVPKVLKCQHTFCKSCLEKWLRQHHGGALSCPNCREITNCPNDDINNLPSNLTYKKFRDILETFSKGRENECERHKERVKFYCEQCEICICSECVIVQHRDKDHHNILTLEEGVMKQKGKLECKVAEAKASRSDLVSYIASLEKQNKNINNSIDRATDEVHRVTEHWINLIRQHEISVTEQLSMQRSSFHETFSRQLSNSNEKLSGIDKLLELSGKVLQENNITEILNVKEVLERRSRELSTDFKLTPYLDIKYIPNDKLPLHYAPGKLVTTCTDPSMSVAKGRGLTKISEGEEGTFTVITNDSEGKTTYSEIDNVVVEIKANHRGIKDIDPEIKDLKDGRYSVAYTSSAGKFNVSIKVRGEPIKCSPFKLTILKKKVNSAVKTVLKDEHKIGGALLKVVRCPEKRKALPDQVFSEVTAIMDPFDLHIQRQEANQMLEKIKAEVGISFECSGKRFVIQGKLSQITECHNLVKKNLTEEESISAELSKLSVEAEAQKHPKPSEIGRAEASPTSKNLNVIATVVDYFPDEGEVSAHYTLASMDPLATLFMSQFFNKQIQNISKKYLVEFVTLDGGCKVALQPKQGCDLTRYNNARSDFHEIISSVTKGMVTWEMDLKGADEGSADALIQYIATRYPVVIDRTHEHGPFVIYGDAASVREVQRTVEGGMSEQAIYNTPIGAEGMGMVALEGVSIETSNHRTENGVNISLRYGDITGEDVDAIVNPANKYLTHLAGLAKVIVQQGGSEIQRESDKLIKKRGFQSLHVGDAVHTIAGRLPCKFIIHAVGPEWDRQSDKKSKKLLQKACFESLKLASQLGLSSVALPAISTSIFHAPIDVCAFAMLNAVQEYLAMPSEPKKDEAKKKGSKETGHSKVDRKKPGEKKKPNTTNEAPTATSEAKEDPTKPGGLHDIRFVLIDADAMDVFEKEFTRRFGSNHLEISDDDDDEV